MFSRKSSSHQGRPRTFDTRIALGKAMKVFWKKGYEGTSLSDLTKAMKINRPSLYSAYGNKESLFMKTLDFYAEGPGKYFKDALEEKSARLVAEKILDGAVRLLTDPQNPGGCFWVQGALACGDEGHFAQKELSKIRRKGLSLLKERFKLAKTTGDLPRHVDHEDVARYIITIILGMSVQASGGATRSNLKAVVRMALHSLPF